MVLSVITETIVTGCIQPIVACAAAPIVERLRAVFFYRTYVGNMRTEMRRLNNVKNNTEDDKKRNKEKCLVVPDLVDTWLADVKTTNEKVESVPDDAGHFFRFMNRYELAKKAMEITEEIEMNKERHSQITWTEDPVLLAEFGSTYASTSTPSVDQVDFPSRVQTYNKALEALGPYHSSCMVALYGMAGVGKTTLMKKLVKNVAGKFKYVVEVVIGENPDLMAIHTTRNPTFSKDTFGGDRSISDDVDANPTVPTKAVVAKSGMRVNDQLALFCGAFSHVGCYCVEANKPDATNGSALKPYTYKPLNSTDDLLR